MHFSRRNEPFRYEFPEPLKGKFRITKINGVEVESSFGELTILDLSISGAKIITPLDFQAQHHDVELEVHFQISSLPFILPGKVMYQEPYGNEYHCGLSLDTDESIREQLIDELKVFARQLLEESK